MTKYLSCAETAKIVRQILKESFPGVAFSVRSSNYAGGASISVRWVDGPTVRQTDEVIGVLEASYFDGMTDYKGSRFHVWGGEAVRFGADFINTTRERSDAEIEKACARFNAKWLPEPDDLATLEKFKKGQLWRTIRPGVEPATLIRADLGKRTRIVAQPSATRDAIKCVGDDGYRDECARHEQKKAQIYQFPTKEARAT